LHFNLIKLLNRYSSIHCNTILISHEEVKVRLQFFYFREALQNWHLSIVE